MHRHPLDLPLAAWTLHDANGIAGAARRRRVVRVEERAGGAVPTCSIGGGCVAHSVRTAAAVLVLHGSAARRPRGGGRLGGGLGLGGAFRVVIASIDHLEATGQRALAARAAEAVWMVRLAVHVEALAVPAAEHTDEQRTTRRVPPMPRT